MKPEDRIRAAFNDLSRRVADEPTRPFTPGTEASPRARWLPALAGAAGVIVVIGGIALLQILPGEPAVTVPPATEATPPTTTVPPPTTTPTTEPVSAQPDDRFRVDGERVAGDASDPFLNVRIEPDPGADLLAKLPPTYRGLRATGAEASATDGGSWVEVELLHPTPLTAGTAPTDGTNPTGWVNSAFILPLADGISVGSGDLEPCSGEGEFGDGDGAASYVASLEVVRLSSGCVRIVVGFGFGTGDFEWANVTGSLLTSPPAWQELQNPLPFMLALPNSTMAWPQATDAGDVYVVRRPDLSVGITSLEPADRVIVRAFEGMLVIDLEGGTQPPAIKGANVVLMREPSVNLGSVDVTGLARPFEANLGVMIEDQAGQPVEALWSGSSFLGTIVTDAYAVMTNDWMTAWGSFAARAEGLEAGSYVLVLSPDGGSDQPRTLRIPFEVEEAGSVAEAPSAEANAIAIALAAFASGGAAPAMTDQVMLRLGPSISEIRTAASLTDPSNWTIDAPEFRAYSGPFDFLGFVRNRPFVSVAEGQVNHCASAPVEYWPTVRLVRPAIHMQPIGIDSCLEWFHLALRVDQQGRIAEVVLDIWEP